MVIFFALYFSEMYCMPVRGFQSQVDREQRKF
jgi:hypothetical protein